MFLCVVLISSCSKSRNLANSSKKSYDFEIKGQIFAIQKNRLNVKMGGVELSYVPSEVFRKRSEWVAVNQEKARQISNYRGRLNQMINRIDLVEMQPYASKIEGFLSATRQFQSSASNRLTEEPRIKELESIGIQKDANSDTFINSDFSTYEAQQWAVTAIFFEWLDRAATANTVTDADGNYSIAVPAGEKGYMLAQASRLYGRDQSENYFWIQEVSGQEKTPIHLNTNNTLTPQILDGMLRQATAQPRGSIDLIADEFRLPKLSWFGDAESLLREMDSNQQEIGMVKKDIDSLDSKLDEIKLMSEP